MSMVATLWAWKQKVENPMRKLILLHMSDASSEANDWQSWYSLGAISARCECSRGTVRNHINALVDTGFLTLTKPASRHGKPAKYRLNVGKIEIQDGPSTGDEGGTRDVLGGYKRCTTVVQEMCEGGTTVVPEPVKEPINKPLGTKTSTQKSKHYFPEQEIIIEMWNSICVPAGMPKVLSWRSTESEKRLAAVWNRHDLLNQTKVWEALLLSMAQDDSCCGKIPPTGNYPKPWKATIHWLVTGDNAGKLLERFSNEQGASL